MMLLILVYVRGVLPLASLNGNELFFFTMQNQDSILSVIRMYSFHEQTFQKIYQHLSILGKTYEKCDSFDVLFEQKVFSQNGINCQVLR